MAAESGGSDLALTTRTLEQELMEEPYRFEFFQAVRLLERFSRGRTPVGRFAKPQTEVVRFGAASSLAFPASEIQSIEPRNGEPPLMRVNFMGLTGPEGLLPLYYTQLVAERVRARDTAMRDFLDIFNHRMVSLFYQAWEKYRFGIEYERSGRDQVSRHLLDFIGLGTEGLQNRQAISDYSLMYYAGLLSQRPRSAVVLRRLLEDYFEVPVAIEQFAGAWYRLSPDMQCCMDRDAPGDSERVGIGAVVGDEVWDEQSRVRIVLGPLTMERYLDFLPTGTAFEPLRALTRFFSGNEFDFEVRLVLERGEVPPCELGREDAGGPQLGWTSWVKSAPMGRDPGDTVLEL
ncbi:MAG: type VI secretion system baseplate subunit TssG [Rhodospirillales bacterium]